MAWATRPRLVLVFAMLILASALFVPSSATAYARCACTDWAHRNRPDLPSNLGNALSWGARARAQGFPVDGNPRAGDIVVFQPGVQGAHRRLGHVAYVVGVGGGKIQFTEFNGTCRVNSRSARITGGMAFIHRR
jgi:peptidoglycan DL-endopeptidase CwlO